MNILLIGLFMERLLPATVKLCRPNLESLNKELQTGYRELEIWCHHYLDDFIYDLENVDFYIEGLWSDLYVWYWDLYFTYNDFRIRRLEKWLDAFEGKRASRSDYDSE